MMEFFLMDHQSLVGKQLMNSDMILKPDTVKIF